MCGRFTLNANATAIETALGAELPEPPQPDYNIGPGRAVLAARQGSGKTVAIGNPHWGHRDRGHFVINARLETADRIPLFREAWRSGRCLLPADGFYEWRREGARKTPFYFQGDDQSLFLFAGLLLPSAEPDRASDCVILTTQAGPALADIHHRMPVALASARRDDWLAGNLDRPELTRLAAAFPWSGHPVSTRVNTVRNNGPALIESVTGEGDPQLPLF